MDNNIKVTCKKCGLSSENVEGNRFAIHEDLRRKGATIFPFVGTRCKCGAVDSFEEKSNKQDATSV